MLPAYSFPASVILANSVSLLVLYSAFSMGSSGEADQLKDLSKDIDASGSEIKSVPSINLSINE